MVRKRSIDSSGRRKYANAPITATVVAATAAVSAVPAAVVGSLVHADPAGDMGGALLASIEGSMG